MKPFRTGVIQCMIVLSGTGNNMSSSIMHYYYSTIMSFYHIRSREQAKYEAVIHRSVLV